MAMKRALAAKKKASPEKLEKRAKTKAINIIRAKFIKDKDYNSMSYAEKISVDAKVQSKKSTINKIAKKLMPQLKKAEAERFEKQKESEATSS